MDDLSAAAAAPPSAGPDEAGPVLTPCQFGRLTLLKPIARGGMGEVFLATTGGIEGAERPCVVKIIRREHAKDKSFLARFFDEARIQAQLQHPGVAQILEAATDPSGKPFVVMEYIEGRNLGEVRQRATQLRSQISWADSVAVAVCVAEALMHIHERTDAAGLPLSIVHRDLSPQNIMVGYGGELKLIDFGTARGENRRCHTVSGVVFAKPGYVAPEVANNTPGGPPSDLYALGIMLWELIAGRRFLSGEPTTHLSEVAAGRRVPGSLALSMSVPLEIDTIISRLTAHNVKDRYQTAREALRDLLRTLKRAPSLANGERGVRARIAHLMGRLYPVEPSRSRAEFARLLAQGRAIAPNRLMTLPESPAPGAVADDGVLPGTRYRLLRLIARGVMGEVHEAEHLDLGRRTALKVLPRERCNNKELEERFRSEARVIARLSHPNLVALHDFGVCSDGRPYYAMDLLEGETLHKRMERCGPLPYRTALSLGVQALQALEVAHKAGVIHCDIKPANLFVTQDDCLKLLDFGVAKSNKDVEAKAGEAMALLGTPEYMAPEQALGQVDERADLYALGAVLYELITGHLPHSASTTMALLDKKAHAAPPVASQRGTALPVPPNVDRLLAKALQLDPNQRFASAAQMREAIEAVLRKRRISPRRTAVAAMLATLLVAFGVHAVSGPVASSISHADPVVATTRSTMTDTQGNPTAPRLALSRDNASPDSAAPTSTGSEVHTASAPLAAVPTPQASATATATDDSAAVNENETQVDQRTASATPGKEIGLPEDPVQSALVQARTYSKQGREIAALGVYRKLGQRYPQNPIILQGWSTSAAETQGWGEALRVAIRWAAIDSSPSAQLHLARTQRRVGQRTGAISTLQRLLQAEPNHPQATALLAKYGG
jgi:serine/threonine-protein kinase